MVDASMTQPNSGGNAAWRALVDKALKGAPFDSLVTTTLDGLVLDPLYAPAEPVYAGRATVAPWAVVARVDGDDPEQTAIDLENGASALSLVFPGCAASHGRGLKATQVDTLDVALSGVMVDAVALHVEAGADADTAFAMLTALCDARGTPPAALHAGLDPLGSFAADGRMRSDSETRTADAVRAFMANGTHGTVLRGDGRAVHEAGGTAAQELGFALASLAASVRMLDTQGIGPDTTLPLASLALSADIDLVVSIAKLRAARRLFALLCGACGVSAPLTLHVTTSARMMSYSDPHTNLLRLTGASFAAAVGGADAIDVLPFDAAGSRFARRMARNIQLLLREESHLSAYADPAAGAGALEAATDQVAEAAWTIFQRYEARGLRAAIESGEVVADITASAQTRAASFSAGEHAVIGVTKHPPVTPSHERPAAATPPRTEQVMPVHEASFGAMVAAARAGASLADLHAAGPAPITTAPLRPRRDAGAFEDDRHGA